MSESATERRSSSAVLIIAFVSAFTVGLAALHYQDRLQVVAAEAWTWLETLDKKEAFGKKGVSQSLVTKPKPQLLYSVQVGAYETWREAEAVERLLSSRHKGVFVAAAEVAGKRYYRVRIPIETKAEGTRLAARLQRESNFEAWVVSPR
jgi:cell division protein FtsN